ncbi:MAG: 2-dehydropantoate 2-reductase [Paludibacteraceae bacterium]|nr:2-dehydropantoate 2-reductase [Paludibacteraceae bacterium]
MRYAIVGTGAMGGLFGGMLAHAGFDVHFLFRSDYKDVKEKGFTVDSILGKFTLQNVNAYNSTENMPKCDVILVCIKTVYENRIPNLIKPILKPDSLIILIQNGINMEPYIAKQLPDTVSIAAGMVMASVTKTAPAVITHTNFGTITTALYKGNDNILKEFCNDINSTGLRAVHSTDYITERWRKLVWNMPYNGLSVALDATTKDIMNNPATRQRAYSIMLEVVKAAKANGAKLTNAYADEMMTATDGMVPYKPSMYVDYARRRPMEIQYLYTEVIKAAKAKGVEVPYIEELEKQLIQKQNEINS